MEHIHNYAALLRLSVFRILLMSCMYSFLGDLVEHQTRPLESAASDLIQGSSVISLSLSCDRYQHSRQLVVALNRFADTRADLPQGWEKKLNQEGKVHTARK